MELISDFWILSTLSDYRKNFNYCKVAYGANSQYIAPFPQVFAASYELFLCFGKGGRLTGGMLY